MKKFRFRARPDNKKLMITVLIGILLLIGGVFVVYGRYGGKAPVYSPAGGTAEVHFIDVGQGDCSLIRAGSADILIDSGEYEQYRTVALYLTGHGVDALDYIVMSHPHTDHMGCMYRLVEKFGGKVLIMPDVKELEPDIPQYRKLMEAVGKRDITVMYAEPGTAVELEDNCRFEILSPAAEYGDLNNMSVTVRFVYGAVSFLFTGDIEREAEADILASGRDISADVLKVPHHGSGTSSSKVFVQAVSPRYAVFSVGAGNDYGHPHSNIVGLYRKLGADILRTDMNGNIVFVTDGSVLSVSSDR